MQTFDPIAFARTSASIAVDSGASEFGTLEAAIGSYRDNVIDTCNEHGVEASDALRTYDALVADLQRDSKLSTNARQVTRRMARAARKARGY